IEAGLLETLIIRQGTVNEFPLEAVTVSDAVMKKLSANVSLNDCIAVCRKPDVRIEKKERVIVLERVQDPGNLGTIIRTAYSLGYDAVYLSNDCCDEYNEKCLQSTQGAIFHLPVIRKSMPDIVRELRMDGLTLIATCLREASMLRETAIPARYALIFGNEGRGLTEETIDASDLRVKIEMDRFESLNVAAAAAICAYQFRYGRK
ncbi:MAG: RNA methyltransferase, partial [Erysipelotrichaceae bacterium]|nr:RNA methyltransferase [Erysipelotrichaceae bacterium]